jgi:protein-tyrosine-phosphatase
MLMETREPYNVLFLCTGNSARSIMAESALSRWGRYRFRAHSAGSHPTGRVHPMTITLLQELHYSTDGLRSKSWDEFARPHSPHLHFVFTVCDKAAGEACPIWPGQPISAHWGVEDPADVVGDESTQRAAFYRAYTALETRIKLFTNLRLDDIDALALKKRLDDIGHTPEA